MRRAICTLFLTAGLGVACASCASGDEPLGTTVTRTVFATTSGSGTMSSPGYRMRVHVGAPPNGKMSSASHQMRVGPKAR